MNRYRHEAAPHTDAAAVRTAGQRTRLVAGVMVLSVVTLMVVLWILTNGVLGGPERPPGAPYLDLGVSFLPALLLVLAAGLLVTTPLVERRLLAGPAVGMSADASDGSARHAGLNRYVTVKVMTLGMREAVGVLGLLVGLVGDPRFGYILGATALLALAFGWPRHEEVEAAARVGGG